MSSRAPSGLIVGKNNVAIAGMVVKCPRCTKPITLDANDENLFFARSVRDADHGSLEYTETEGSVVCASCLSRFGLMIRTT